MIHYKDTPIKNPLELLKETDTFLVSHKILKSELKSKAQQLLYMINEIDNTIQDITSRVCIDCTDVCCINKHGYYEFSDIIYICLIEEDMPFFRNDLTDTEPCQFLSQKGCSLSRFKRPFRCNWYFCSDLIRFIGMYGKKRGRTLSKTMQSIIDIRSEIIETFFRCINENQDVNIRLISAIRRATD